MSKVSRSRMYSHRITRVRVELLELYRKYARCEEKLDGMRKEQIFHSERIKKMYDEFNRKWQDLDDKVDGVVK